MSLSDRLNLFRDYAQRRWGEVVRKVSLHAGGRCPNRDRGGCVYCSAESYRPFYLDPADPVPRQIAQGKEYLRGLNVRRYLACFQHETSTAGEFDELLPKFRAPLADADCVGLSLSTRPDHVFAHQLEPLEQAIRPFPEKPVILELGLQSASAASLEWLNRNHTADDFVQALAALRQFPRFETGAHLILGIPGETLDDMRRSVQIVGAHGVRHLKLHHLQVIRDTPLAKRWRTQPFALPTAEEYCEWLAALLPWVPQSTILHRCWGNAAPRLLLQPRWNLHPNQLYDHLRQTLERHNVHQGQLWSQTVVADAAAARSLAHQLAGEPPLLTR